MSSQPLPAVRCWNCNLNQFPGDTCRRCRQPLEKPEPPKLELVVRKSTSWKSSGFHEEMSKRIGRRFRCARKAKGLSQREVGNILGVQRTYVTKIESGRVQPTVKQLERLAKSVGTTVAYLVSTKQELDLFRIMANPFLMELIEAGNGLSSFYWKKVADKAEELAKK